ncbi:MAG: protoheme IX farnesyltransferase [Planctomycetes bacterium]|nr:protoheme IX farnesyltransferase [Planctomycetota bacterium]
MSPSSKQSNYGRAAERAWPTRIQVLWELGKPRLALSAVALTVVGGTLAGGLGFESYLRVTLGSLCLSWGCAAGNMLLERNPDARMKRTCDRPLPTGRVRPGAVLGWALLSGVVGLSTLASFGHLPLLAGLVMAVLYLGVYTPLKRRTVWNTVLGAIPGALPPVIGALAGGTGKRWALSLFLVVFFWQIPHFLPLAFLHAEDYERGGFVMLPGAPDGLRRTARWMRGWGLALAIASFGPILLGLMPPVWAGPIALCDLWFLRAVWQASRAPSTIPMRRAFRASLVYLGILPALYLLGAE